MIGAINTMEAIIAINVSTLLVSTLYRTLRGRRQIRRLNVRDTSKSRPADAAIIRSAIISYARIRHHRMAAADFEESNVLPDNRRRPCLVTLSATRPLR